MEKLRKDISDFLSSQCEFLYTLDITEGKAGSIAAFVKLEPSGCILSTGPDSEGVLKGIKSIYFKRFSNH